MKPKFDTMVSDNNDTSFPVCKICFLHKNPINSINDLIAPCGCRGSIKFVHRTCLKLWRFKGKHIREIKRCEQCLCEYKYLGDYLPHKCLVRITTAAAIISILYVSNLILNSFTEALVFLVNEPQENIRFEAFWKDININQAGEFKYNSMRYEGVSYMASTVVVMMGYVFTFCWNFWPVLNFFFTIWRVFQFNMIFDRYFLGGTCCYYIYRMYNNLFEHIDSLYVFLLNYRG